MKIEQAAAKVTDLKDGEMKEVTVGETKVLLARVNGKFHAVAGLCTHYGGPLPEGVLSGHKIICPWHQAQFSLLTGDLEEPPALDAVPRFDVRIEGDNVVVAVPEGTTAKRTPSMARHDPRADGRTFVILGTGAAGNAAAETLRQDGFQGRVVMVSQENRLPYDRPALSKGYMHGATSADALPLRSEEFYNNHDIEVLLGQRVIDVSISARRVGFENGPSLKYDALLLATGGTPRRPQLPGANLENVLTLRSFDDASRIAGAAKPGLHAVVMGASFIGMEIASSLTRLGLSVTVVAPENVPFERTLGEQIGAMWQQVHEKRGVTFLLGSTVARIEGSHKVKSVVLGDGKQLKADLVVIGIGVRPATEYLRDVKLSPDGSVPVDGFLRVREDVYAAGDIASFPDWRSGQPIRIEHWRLAEQHGRIAAHNMAGRKVQFTSVPFFWTEQFEVYFQYVGHATTWDDVIFHGDVSKRKFVAFYVKDNKIVGTAGCNRDVQIAAAGELMRINRLPTPEELRGGPIDLVERLKR